tara:strand:+ start:1632 stop:2597 length:966 start_codon:yes stop_codon:yes gene_type:complete
MTHTLDTNRRDLPFFKSKVKDVLPEYAQEDFPNLVTFLEKYYDFISGEDNKSYDRLVHDIFSLKDATQTELEYLDFLLAEIGNGLTNAAFFKQPRLMTRLLALFYQSKGTLVSAEGFFRGFFNQEVSVEYPKKDTLTINDADNNFLSHKIGFESQKFITNDKRFQVFSILIKTGLAVRDYETLYKKFVHPAGFYFEGEVQLENPATITPTAQGQNPLDSAEAVSIVGAGASLSLASFDEPMTALITIGDSTGRATLNDLISNYSSVTATELESTYDNVLQIISPNSFTFDDSADSIGPDTTLTIETMDASMFTRYLSDSNF